MDRPTTRADADARTTRIDLPEAFLPPSRQAILDLCRAALGAGPILLTGDAGIGKSWIIGQLIEQVATTRWVTIDLTPSDGPVDLYRHLARGLGLGGDRSVAPSRLDIADALSDRSADGEPWALVIDEAQNLGPDVWEEVRVLTNRFGAADGFAHLVLVGQTALVRRFSTRALAAIEARLAAHLHLRPIDVAEAAEWLARRHPGLDWSVDEVEAIHRDSGGNPSRLIRRSAAISARPDPAVALAPPAPAAARAPARNEIDLDDFGSAAMIAHRPAMAPPLTGVGRPPLHSEENSIEVGWSADEADSVGFDDEATVEERDLAGRGIVPRVEESEQAVHDHYAALQAWREWADNQEKRAKPAKSDRDLADEIDEAAAAEAADHAEPAATDRGSIRVEGQQPFAPFGPLFTKLAPVREP